MIGIIDRPFNSIKHTSYAFFNTNDILFPSISIKLSDRNESRKQ
jgi:hypothetical protein